MDEYKIYRLRDLVSIKYGKDHKALSDGTIPVFGSGGIMRYVNQAIYDKPSVLIPRKGSLNNIIYSDTSFWTVDTMFWTVVNENIVNSRYLYYNLCRFDFAGMNVGSAVPSLTVPVIEAIELNLPPLCIQKEIVRILKSLDDKIALNKRINDNLEKQAQALYKSWFVDFEPFKDGKFVDSELGEIPEGWNICTLRDLIIVKYGKDHKRLHDGKIPVYGSGGVMRYVDEYLHSGESVLIPRKGTLNNVFYVNEKFWSVDTMFYTQMKQRRIAKYIYFFVSSQNLISMNAGSAVPSMTTEILNSLKCVIAPLSVMERFDVLQTPIFETMRKNSVESEKLSEIRDSLLPKLMSGELKINDLNS